MAASIEELTRQASFVFEGTVRRPGTLPQSGIETAPATAVVHIHRIFKGPEVFSRFAGKEVTVAFGGREGVSSGRRAVFFTRGLYYGEGLTLDAAGQIEAGPATEREVREAMTRGSDNELVEHLREARLVVSGVVIAVAPHERRAPVGTEHDPEWWEGVIEVNAFEKGTVKAEKHKGAKTQITVFFAHSTDVAWYRAPKLHVQDRGVFILHEGEFRKQATPGPSLIHPVDFRPESEVERVRELLRRNQ